MKNFFIQVMVVFMLGISTILLVGKVLNNDDKDLDDNVNGWELVYERYEIDDDYVLYKEDLDFGYNLYYYEVSFYFIYINGEYIKEYYNGFFRIENFMESQYNLGKLTIVNGRLSIYLEDEFTHLKIWGVA